MTEPIDTDEQAFEELSADNVRRMQELLARKIQVGGIDDMLLLVMLEHVLLAVDGQEALTRARLDFAGRLSQTLDEAEKQAARAVLLQS